MTVHDALQSLREELKQESIDSAGCPVARNAAGCTPEQLQWLTERGHLDPTYTGWHATDNGILRQGAYTAIDDVIWTWGAYLERYAEHLIANGHPADEIEPTDVDQVLYLDVEPHSAL